MSRFIRAVIGVALNAGFSTLLAAPAPNGPDPDFFALQWGLHNTGQVINGVAGTPGADIDVLSAWDIYPGGANVVAIVGTGVNAHPEFSSRLLPGFVANAVGGDPFSTLDTGPRGTREAGIIAAAANSAGIVGVNPNARILPVRVINGTSTSPQKVAEGIVWAVDHGASVVLVPIRFANGSPALANAVAYAATKNVVCVAPTGNTSDNAVAFPARYDECIAVASTTSVDQRAPFSNFGDQVEVAAPGVDIYSTTAGGGFAFESASGGQSAAALVAGVVSLMRSYAPQLSASEIRTILASSADDLGDAGWDPFFGAGRVNARRAIEMTPAPALRVAWEGGVPRALHPNRTTTAIVTIFDEGETLVADSPALVYRELPAGAETTVPLRSLGNRRFAVDFPVFACGQEVEFYLSAQSSAGTTTFAPNGAPASVYAATAVWREIVFEDDFEQDRGWWSHVLGSPATGLWERVDPVGTFLGNVAVQPEYDASPNERSMCAVTGQQTAGGVGANDVDGGPVSLVSPALGSPAREAEISYWRWVYSESGQTDMLSVELSRDDGNTWIVVEEVGTTDGWKKNKFLLSDFPGAVGEAFRMRFVIDDLDNDSLTEAAVDEVRMTAIRCNELHGDVNDDGRIDLVDYELFEQCMVGPVEMVLRAPCVFLDISGDNQVDLRDAARFLSTFSP